MIVTWNQCQPHATFFRLTFFLTLKFKVLVCNCFNIESYGYKSKEGNPLNKALLKSVIKLSLVTRTQESTTITSAHGYAMN